MIETTTLDSYELYLALYGFQSLYLPWHPISAQVLHTWQLLRNGNPYRIVTSMIITCDDQAVCVYDQPTDRMVERFGFANDEVVIDFDGELVGCGGEEIPTHLIERVVSHLLGTPLALTGVDTPSAAELANYVDHNFVSAQADGLSDFAKYNRAAVAARRAEEAQKRADAARSERDRLIEKAGATLEEIQAADERHRVLNRGSLD